MYSENDQFQLIVDNRVAAKGPTLDCMLRSAAQYLSSAPQGKVEIIDLSGTVYKEADVRARANELTQTSHGH